MTFRTLFVLLPAGRNRLASLARGVLPWRPALDAPAQEPDEDLSPTGLLATARDHLNDWFSLFGAPSDLARADSLTPSDRLLIRDWTRNLAYLVRHLVMMAALSLLPMLPAEPAQRARTPGTRSARLRHRRRRTLAIGVGVEVEVEAVQAAPVANAPRPNAGDSHPAAEPRPAANCAQPEGARWAQAISEIATTLADFEACARRVARRLLRRKQAVANPHDPTPDSLLHIVLADPPVQVTPDGRYVPLSRKAQLVWAAARDAIDAWPPAPLPLIADG
jgi:hypothetical protein